VNYNYKMPRYRREYRAIAAVNFGATGIIGVAEV